MRKKLLFCCLLIITILAVSSTAFAARYVAEIGNKKYTTVSKAVKDVQRGETIKLLRDASWSYPGAIYPDKEGIAGKKFTIDLAQHVLLVKKKIFVGGGTNLIIKNGTIKGRSSNGPCFEAGAYSYQNDRRRSRLTFQRCKIKMLRRAFFLETNLNADIVMKNTDLSFAKAATCSALEIGEDSTLKVTGGSWTGGKENQVIIQNSGTVKIARLDYKGRSLLSTGDGSALITSGTYYLKNDYVRDLITVSGGKLTISGGKFTSETSGLIGIDCGTMIMTGGTLHNIQIPVNNTYSAPYETDSGYYTPGHSGPVCIYISASDDEETVVKLNGGKVISDHGCCIYRTADDGARITVGGATCTPLAGAPVTFIYSYTR